MIAIVTLPFSAPGEVAQYIWVLLVLPLLVIGLLPKNLDRLTHLLFKVLRREPPDHEFTLRGVLIALGWQTFGWVAVGGEVFVLCWALHAPIGRVAAAGARRDGTRVVGRLPRDSAAVGCRAARADYDRHLELGAIRCHRRRWWRSRRASSRSWVMAHSRP